MSLQQMMGTSAVSGMMYLGINQHRRQLTISPREENGDVIEIQQGLG